MIIPISGDMNIEKTLSESDLNDLLDRISVVLGYKEIMQKFNCTVKDARDIKEELERSYDCRECDLRMKECYRCCKVCESPLEQALLKALVRNNINVELQLRINKDNTISHFPDPVEPDKILTIPDFYVETENAEAFNGRFGVFTYRKAGQSLVFFFLRIRMMVKAAMRATARTRITSITGVNNGADDVSDAAAGSASPSPAAGKTSAGTSVNRKSEKESV